MSDYLKGGRDTIYESKDLVYRPAGSGAKEIHKFLNFLHDNKFEKVPYPHGSDGKGVETLSFIEGKVHNGLLPTEVQSDEALSSFCEVIRRYHDLGAVYIESLKGDEKWLLESREPIETMCHGDLAPYNTVMIDEEVVGIIDFDTLHPGPRMWDLAYGLYRWIPLMATDNPENFGSEADKMRRLKVFFNSYGIENVNLTCALECTIKRLEALIGFMEDEAEKGNDLFRMHIDEGHIKQYRLDIEYIINFKKRLDLDAT